MVGSQILALSALAELSASYAVLVALAVPLIAPRLLAVAAAGVENFLVLPSGLRSSLLLAELGFKGTRATGKLVLNGL